VLVVGASEMDDAALLESLHIKFRTGDLTRSKMVLRRDGMLCIVGSLIYVPSVYTEDGWHFAPMMALCKELRHHPT
jgi:hypothetical protein